MDRFMRIGVWVAMFCIASMFAQECNAFGGCGVAAAVFGRERRLERRAARGNANAQATLSGANYGYGYGYGAGYSTTRARGRVLFRGCSDMETEPMLTYYYVAAPAVAPAVVPSPVSPHVPPVARKITERYWTGAEWNVISYPVDDFFNGEPRYGGELIGDTAPREAISNPLLASR